MYKYWISRYLYMDKMSIISELPVDNFMRLAIKEANKALTKEEVPIGAIIVLDGKVIGRGHNQKESKCDATLHAEMIAIKNASKKIGSWRLNECDMYVTLEPCPMCAGALIQARVGRLFFGALDPKAGAVGSVINLLAEQRFNHTVVYTGGILEDECGMLLTDFFTNLRKKKKV